MIRTRPGRALRRLVAALVVLHGSVVLAEEDSGASEEAASVGAGAPDTLGTVVTLGVGLLVVVALILGCAWVARRVQGFGGVNSQALKVAAVLSVGQKERVALIDVGEKQILIGITPQSVRTLHVFDEPVVNPSAQSGGDFAQKLQQVMGRGNQSAGGSHDT